MRRGIVGLLLLVFAAPLSAATVVSPAPDSVSVTVYRAPGRSGGGTFDLDSLDGFALVTETRRVRLEAGENIVRFEGVAGGIVPVSAIVTGLPGGVVQKNRDANLLSPAALLRGSYGRRLVLRRTDPATGKVSAEAATLLGGPAGGVVIRTAKGIEALRCSGLPETLTADTLPEGLVPSPTLSVTTRAERAAEVTVTLSYLAERFDWSANYVATLSADGRSIALSAWATLANGNDEGFADASAQLVAGTLSRVDAESLEQNPLPARIEVGCWPIDTTHDGSEGKRERDYERRSRSELLMSSPVAIAAISGEDLVLTARRVAQRERLGDLKLYRVPERVTIAAQGQKQVALVAQPQVAVERIYRFRVGTNGAGREIIPARAVLRTRNDAAHGLGLPLPGGQVAVMETGPDRPLLAGEGAIRDVAENEELELEIGESRQVVAVMDEDGEDRETIALSNANPSPALVEVELDLDEGDRPTAASARLGRKDGRPLWRVTVPANARATLSYRVAAADAGGDSRQARRR